MSGGLTHPLLTAAGVRHAFGTRGHEGPAGLLRPRQVHGSEVAVVDTSAAGSPGLGDADAVVTTQSGQAIGIVTADCLPILAASSSGHCAAIHAGWRGLAAGVIEGALAEMSRLGAALGEVVAVIGPHICAHHYEVDAPVVEALRPRHQASLCDALRETRPDHWQLDLAYLARRALIRAGLSPQKVATCEGTCTFEDAARFASRRRDGAGGDRLIHWIERAPSPALDSPKGAA